MSAKSRKWPFVCVKKGNMKIIYFITPNRCVATTRLKTTRLTLDAHYQTQKYQRVAAGGDVSGCSGLHGVLRNTARTVEKKRTQEAREWRERKTKNILLTSLWADIGTTETEANYRRMKKVDKQRRENRGEDRQFRKLFQNTSIPFALRCSSGKSPRELTETGEIAAKGTIKRAPHCEGLLFALFYRHLLECYFELSASIVHRREYPVENFPSGNRSASLRRKQANKTLPFTPSVHAVIECDGTFCRRTELSTKENLQRLAAC